MKNILILFIALFLVTGILSSFAAIPVANVAASNNSKAETSVTTNRLERKGWFAERVEQVTNLLYPEHRTDTLGRLSLVFGICGFIPVVGWMFATAAIILGALGMHKKQKKARIGLILGIVSLALGIIVFAAILFALSV